MLVYHGTNADITDINITIGSRFKDFGQGFYVTPALETAQRMARKKASLFKGKPIVISYEFDESVLRSERLKVLTFPERATAEWINFVSSNRDRYSIMPPHSYDLVKGPIADDGVALQLTRLKLHADEAEQIALDLQDKYLDQQLCFCTQHSLSFLRKVSVCELI